MRHRYIKFVAISLQAARRYHNSWVLVRYHTVYLRRRVYKKCRNDRKVLAVHVREKFRQSRTIQVCLCFQLSEIVILKVMHRTRMTSVIPTLSFFQEVRNVSIIIFVRSEPSDCFPVSSIYETQPCETRT